MRADAMKSTSPPTARLAALPAVLLALLAPGAPAQSVPPTEETAFIDGIAAEVNGEPVTMQQVMDEVRAELQSLSRDPDDAPPGAQQMQALYAKALDEAIRRRLVLLEFADAGMQLPSWFVDKRVSEIIDGRYGGDRSRLVAELAQRHTTFAEWRTHIEESTKLLAMRQLNVDKNVHVGPARIREYYLAHESDFVRPAGVKLSLLFLARRDGEGPGEFEARARAIRARLDREPFAEIARYYSDDASASRGGDWGWIQPAETLRDELAASLASLAVGETGPLVETPAGFYVLRKEGERGDGLQPIESVRDEIDSLLRRAETERLFREWTDSLRAKADVRILRPTM